MIVTKFRLQEEHPMTGPAGTWPLSICDLNLDSSAGEYGYILKEAVGLGPPVLTPVVIGFDTSGIPILDSDPGPRDVVLRIGLSPQLGQSFSELRDNLYKLIGRTVYVKLMNGSLVTAQVTGYIQKVEPVHFSNKPDITVTIECQEGVFSSPNYVDIPVSDLQGMTNPIINYPDGTAPAGLELTFKNLVTSKTGFSISNHSEFWHSGSGDVNNLFQITYTIDPNDIVVIVTHPRNRSIMFYDDSTTTWIDITGYLNAGAVWPMLFPGVNQFAWSLNWVTTPGWTLARYIPRYWGV